MYQVFPTAMGQKPRKVRRLTMHMNAKSAPRTGSRNSRKANLARSSSRSSSPEIPLIVQRQMRLDNKAKSPEPITDPRNDFRLTNTFVADLIYNASLNTILKNESPEKTCAQSVSSESGEANNKYKVPVRQYGSRSGGFLNDVSFARETQKLFVSGY